MKFAIPLAEGKLTAHFGHCEEFAIIEVENDQIKNKEILVPPVHEPGALPRWLHEMGADVMTTSATIRRLKAGCFAKG
jgi:predicted Fe-Mo cluster-binding NifX family protein